MSHVNLRMVFINCSYLYCKYYKRKRPNLTAVMNDHRSEGRLDSFKRDAKKGAVCNEVCVILPPEQTQ